MHDRRDAPSALTPEEALFLGEPPQQRAALDELMGRLGPRLFALARHMVGSADLAEELAQEAFVRLWRRAVSPPPNAPPVSKVYGYLRRVLVNLTYHLHRPDAAAGAAGDDAPDPLDLHADAEPEPADLVIRAESAELCLAAMDRLPPQLRAVLSLRVLEERSYRELADELGWPIGTVMSRLHRARAAVIEMLEQSQPRLRLRRPG